MKPKVSIIMGSTSDMPIMENAAKVLDEFEIPFEINALSAHRTPEKAMEFAKGAVLAMLEESYQKRDKVGFIAFRDRQAVTLLKPTNSIYSAVKKLKELPTGGKTPLSAGLVESLKVMSYEMEKDKNCIPVMILVSDGKANVAMSSKGLKQEIIEASEIIKKKRINMILIDADEGKFKLGYIKEILKVTNGQYFHINQLIDKDLPRTFGLK